MAMVNLNPNWREAVLDEIDNVKIYYKLINILHQMADDDLYTSEICFQDLHKLAIEVRRTIDEVEFPVPVLEQSKTSDN